MFPEPESYEEYVPEGWQGKYEDFRDSLFSGINNIINNNY
jgi:hypothetical protein